MARYLVDYNGEKIFTVEIKNEPRNRDLLRHELIKSIMKINKVPEEFNYNWSGITLTINNDRVYKFKRIN